MDTIYAPATPMYNSAISIIRISGNRSLEVLKDIFRTNRKIEPNYMTYGHIFDQDKKLDEVYSVYFKAPRSYTCEDVVEIHCHGGVISTNRIMELLKKKGLRLAEAGEFTQRAFINGRIDLTQAESVMDLISSKSNLAFDMALNQLEGRLSNKIISSANKLMDLLAKITVCIDYPEEDIEEITYKEIEDDLNFILKDLKRLNEDAKRALSIKQGINTAIIGRTNVGKSSLLNYITGKDRAIVTDIEGTTRDTIEEEVVIDDIYLRLIDTAGIRESLDLVEKIGIEKSYKALDRAELIFFVIDVSRDITEEELNLIKDIDRNKLFIILNKIDLNEVFNIEKIAEFIDKSRVVRISAYREEGIDTLKDRLREYLKINDKIGIDPMITSKRQLEHLVHSIEMLELSLSDIINRIPYDYITVNLEEAYTSLQSIVGKSLNADVTQEIFSRFCLGK